MLLLSRACLVLAVANRCGASMAPTVGLVLEDATHEAQGLLKETLTNLGKEFHFQTRRLHTSSSQLQHSPGLVGVVAIERCWGRGIVDKPLLSLVLETCDDQPEEPTVIPLSILKESGSEDCLHVVLRLWVERALSGVEGSSRTSPPPPSSNLTVVIRRRLSSSTSVNYLEEAKKCSMMSPSVLRLGGGPYKAMVRARTRSLLQGHTLSIALKHRTPYVFLELEGQQIIGADGILIQLLHSLVRIYNFTYTLKLPDDGQWGSILEDGSWNGMVGEVFRNEMEMALGPTSITEEREKAIDFTTPFDFEPWDIMIPASQESIDLAAFMIPFSSVVWAGLLASWVLVGMLLYLLTRVAATFPNSTSSLPSLPYFLLKTFSSLLSQCVRQPQTEAARVLAGWWWLFCVITITSYSSKLIASITVRLTAPTVTSLLQMVEEQSSLWTYKANSAMEEIFKYSDPNSMFGKVAQLLRETEGLLVNNFEEGVDAVRNKKYAYIEDASRLEKAIADDLAIHGWCRMTLVRDYFFSTRFGMILQRGSPYLEAFSMEILYFIQMGLMDAWKKQFWPAASRCVGATTLTPVRALNFLDIAGTLLLLVAGLALSNIIFFLEFIYWRCIAKH